MLGYSITSPPLVVKDKIITGITGGEFGVRPISTPTIQRQASGSGAGTRFRQRRVRQRYVGGRQLAARRRAHLADGQLRPELNTHLLGHRQSRTRYQRRRSQRRQLIQLLRRCARSRTPANVSGIINSLPTTRTTGIPPKTWCWWIACGTGKTASYCCMAIATAFSMCSTGRTVSCWRLTLVRASWVKGWDKDGRPITTEELARESGGDVTVYPVAGSADRISRRRLTALRLAGCIWPIMMGPIDTPLDPRHSSPASSFRDAVQAEDFGVPQRPPTGAAITRRDGDRSGDRQGAVEVRADAECLIGGRVGHGAAVLVFAASNEGNFMALDAKTGKSLWRFNAGPNIPSSPISYSVDGKQYVAVSSANVLYSFALPD